MIYDIVRGCDHACLRCVAPRVARAVRWWIAGAVRMLRLAITDPWHHVCGPSWRFFEPFATEERVLIGRLVASINRMQAEVGPWAIAWFSAREARARFERPVIRNQGGPWPDPPE